MNADDLRTCVTALAQWKRADEQAPHRRLPGLLSDLVGRIFDTHFPETMHDDIRQALGLNTLYGMRAVRRLRLSAADGRRLGRAQRPMAGNGNCILLEVELSERTVEALHARRQGPADGGVAAVQSAGGISISTAQCRAGAGRVEAR